MQYVTNGGTLKYGDLLGGFLKYGDLGSPIVPPVEPERVTVVGSAGGGGGSPEFTIDWPERDWLERHREDKEFMELIEELIQIICMSEILD